MNIEEGPQWSWETLLVNEKTNPKEEYHEIDLLNQPFLYHEKLNIMGVISVGFSHLEGTSCKIRN